MASTFLVSTVVTGALLLGVAVLFRRHRTWREDKPESEASGFDAISALVTDSRTWIASYVLLMLVAAGSVYITFGGAGVPESIAGAGITILGAVFAVAVLVFVGVGTYTAVRGHDRSSSQAAGMGAFAIGFVLLTAVAVKLVLG